MKSAKVIKGGSDKKIVFSEEVFKTELAKLNEKGFKIVQNDEYELTLVGDLTDTEVCDMFLSFNNPHNRAINQGSLNIIVDSLMHGEWAYTAQPTILGMNGMLGDGQTRLSAIRKVIAERGGSFRMKFTFLKDNEVVGMLYKLMGQQKAVNAHDILKQEGFGDTAMPCQVNTLIGWSRGKIGGKADYRRQLLIDFAKDYREGLFRTCGSVHKQYVNITAPMTTAAMVIGRAFRREEDAYFFLDRVANLSMVLNVRARMKNDEVLDLEDGIPEKTISFWLADGGVSLLKDGKKVSSNGTFASQNAVAVFGRGLIHYLKHEKMNENEIPRLLDTNGWRDVLEETRRQAAVNCVTLFNAK